MWVTVHHILCLDHDRVYWGGGVSQISHDKFETQNNANYGICLQDKHSQPRQQVYHNSLYLPCTICQRIHQ